MTSKPTSNATPKPTRCTMHDTIEFTRTSPDAGYDSYPFRCPRCGECFLCAHKLTHLQQHTTHTWAWTCPDGYVALATPTEPPAVSAVAARMSNAVAWLTHKTISRTK